MSESTVVDRLQRRVERSDATLEKDSVDLIHDLDGALSGLVTIIEAAGLQNLTRGVQLGQTSWYVKASDRMERAKAVLTRTRGETP